jgi:hypothetical protein
MITPAPNLFQLRLPPLVRHVECGLGEVLLVC